MENTLLCCKAGPLPQDACGELAEFEIIDLAASSPDVAVTHACEAHVGALLGHDMNWTGRNLGWQVNSLNPL